jgi:hypothetical protein
LQGFYGPPRGFSFPKEIQPILDRHCIRCHEQREIRPRRDQQPEAITRLAEPPWEVFQPSGDLAPSTGKPVGVHPNGETAEIVQPAFSLLSETVLDRMAKRFWSDAYLNLTLAVPADHDWDRGAYEGLFDGAIVNWIGSQSVTAPLPPYAAGSARSGLFPLLARGHHGVRSSREEWDKLACWIDFLVPFCGDCLEAHAWTPEELATFEKFTRKRRQMEDQERRNCQAWQAHQQAPSPSSSSPLAYPTLE